MHKRTRAIRGIEAQSAKCGVFNRSFKESVAAIRKRKSIRADGRNK
jgi:hypothetical protein